MARAVLIRVSPELHRALRARAGRKGMQAWVVAVLRREVGLAATPRPPSVTEEIRREWQIPGQDVEPPARARRAARATAAPRAEGEA